MKILKLAILFLLVSTTGIGQDIVLNEFCASNNSILQDADGEYSDWIEIFNPTDSKISLLNYGLSDDSGEIRKWNLPDVEISANDFLIIFASGKDGWIGNELHTNFKLKQSGEPLLLTNSQGEIIDFVEPTDVPTDESYARLPDGFGDWTLTNTPTPNAQNISGSGLICSHSSGFYETEFLMEINSPNPNIEIYYTLDGSEPIMADFLYTEPIEVKKADGSYVFSAIPTTPLTGPDRLDDYIWKTPETVQTCTAVRFAAFENGERKGKIYSKNYFVGEDLKNRYDFPVVNILTDSLHLFGNQEGIYIPGHRFDSVMFSSWSPQGNYSNEGQAWERNIHLTYFEAGGKLAFETDAGFRMHGNGSTAFPQKSFKVYFRDEYGMNELDYPIFEDSDNQKYKRLMFRNGGNDFLMSRFKDAMLQKVIADLDVDLQAFQPSVVFINGEYWGLHNIREKYDRFHFKYNFGADKDSVNVIDVRGSVEEGNNVDYQSLINFVNDNDLSIREHYKRVEEWIDIDNFIDFQIAEIYFANYDWPCNNYKIWKPTMPGSKWRFAIYDLDLSFGFDGKSSYRTNSLKHALKESDDWPHCQISNALFRNLIENEHFKTRFIERFSVCLNTTFQKQKVLDTIDEFENLFEDEMPEHIARWNYPENLGEWREEINVLRNFATKRPCVMSEQILAFFELPSFGFDCLVDTISSEEKPVILFPNPNDGNFTIFNGNLENIENGTLRIINAAGQIVYDRADVSINSQERFFMKELNLPLGMYVVILESENLIMREKMILSRER